MDPFILASENTITAAVSGFFGTEKTVRGNATVSLFAFQYGDSKKSYTFVDEVRLFLVIFKLRFNEILEKDMNVMY